ncbi:MAG TPA: sigma 54-interacting transcriptional regulator [Gemmataceae bacterium]|nr:sigma 54-interacting transcriptional regulator [Gemmataceae bacterium]
MSSPTNPSWKVWTLPLGRVRALGAALAGAARSWLGQPVGRRRLLILAAGLLVCSFTLGVLTYVLSIPYLPLRCAFSQGSHVPVINRVDHEFLYPAAPEQRAPLVGEGDTVVMLGDQAIRTWPQLLRKMRDLRTEQPQVECPTLPPLDLPPDVTHLRAGGENLVRVQLRRAGDGHLYSVWCRLGSVPLDALAPSLLWAFLKVGLFIVGALVFWKRPEDRSAAQFFLLCMVTFGAYMGGYHWLRITTQPVLFLVFMVSSILLPAVSLHFYLVFPRPKGFLLRYPRRTLLVIYGPPLLFLLLLVSGYLRVRWLFHGGGSPESQAAVLGVLLDEILVIVYVYFGVAVLWYLASVVCLVHSYQSAADATERNQVKWILIGALAAMVPIGYTLYLAFLHPDDFSGGGAAWPMFAASGCFTAAFTISITRYRLMQLDQIVSSGVMYFLISSLAGLVYYAVVFVGMILVGSRVAGPSLEQAFWVSGTALVMLVVLDLARARLMKVVDRHFRREKHQLDRTLRRLSQAVEQLVDPPALARRLLQASADLLGVPRGSVYLREGDPPLYRLADSLGPAPPLTELSSGCPLIEALRLDGTLVAGPRALTDPAQRQLQYLGGEAAQALVHEGQILAILVLGRKALGSYTPEDLNLLTGFAQITGLALVSAEGRRTIEALNRELKTKVEKIAEQQRRILALQSQLVQGSGVRGQGSGDRGQESGDGGQELGTGKAKDTLLPPDPCPLTPGIVGSSPQVRQLLQLVRKVSASQSVVLIRGESGTGKELLARALHENSPRAGKAFVKVHCAALSPGLLESELFGHVKGAFTGAHRDKVGRFELADGGTLFLDEIGDISLEVQTKLLRVLQERTFERVGSSEPVRVDVRVIAATHQDLERLIAQGRFREDLYYRLNVISVRVPPLRERREDIPELVQHFLRLYSQRCGKEVVQIDDDALALLKAYSWPGNIRQLENVIERAVVIAEGPVVTVEELAPEVRLAASWGTEDSPADGAAKVLPPARSPGIKPLSTVQAERAERDRREREQLVRALAAADGNKAEAARALGMARSTLISRLKKHGLS